jgi:hypothetical protein
MSESEVQQLITLEAMKHGCLLLRNNSGSFVDGTGRHVRFGLGNSSAKINKTFKSSDLIGITTITVTQDMVGKTIGVFTAVECKDTNWPGEIKTDREIAQNNFVQLIKSKGGIAGFSNSVETFIKLLGEQ